jgi:hypothetical protein
MTQPTTAVPDRHWSQMNESTFVPGLRLMLWIYRIFGRWPARLIIYPIVFWYMIAKPGARAASSDYRKRVAAFDGPARVRPGTVTVPPFCLFRRAFSIKCSCGAGFSDRSGQFPRLTNRLKSPPSAAAS